jgi:hypothetical protein
LDFDFVVLCGFGPWKFCDDGGVLDLVMMVVGFFGPFSLYPLLQQELLHYIISQKMHGGRD